MPQQELKLKIGADVSDAVGGVKKLNASIETLRAKLEARKSFLITETDITKIAQYNREIAGLKNQITQITSIGTSGFNSLGAQSVASADKVSGAFTKAFSAVRTAANILPGIGIAGLIGIFSDSIADLVSNVFKATGSLSQFKASKEALDEAFKSDEYLKASSNINELRINVGLAKDGLLDKKEVLNQYNSTIGKTTGEVKTLDQAEQALVKNGPAYLKMILFQAAAHIALEKAAKKAVDAEIDFQDNLKTAANVNKRGSAQTDKATGADGLSEFLSRGIKNEADATKKAADDGVKALENVAEKFQKDAAKISKDFNFDFFGGKQDTKEKVIKAPKIKIEKIDTNFFDTFLSFDPTKVQEKSKDFATAWATFTEYALKNEDMFVGLDDILKIDSKTSAIKAASEWWKNYQEGLVRFKLSPIETITEGPKKKDFGIAGTKKPLEMSYDIRIKVANQEKVKAEAEKLAEDLKRSLNSAFASSLSSGFAGIGEGIGAALAQGVNPIQAAGQAMVGALGDLISQMGKALIEYGVINSGIQAVIAAGFALPGAAAIALGVAAVAAGALLKNAFKPKAFAEGGLVFGPTNALIGEGRGTTKTNPEVVAPLDKLKKMIGGGQQQQVIIPSLEFSYDKARIVFNRMQKHGELVS